MRNPTSYAVKSEAQKNTIIKIIKTKKLLPRIFDMLIIRK